MKSAHKYAVFFQEYYFSSKSAGMAALYQLRMNEIHCNSIDFVHIMACFFKIS